MTILGKITVVLSDDTRYVAGMSYDVVLTTPQTPDPAKLVSGTVETPEPTEGS
jgi:hypothetical protein